MATLPSILLIYASDAPQQIDRLKEILGTLKNENRIRLIKNWEIGNPLSTEDMPADGDLVLVQLTDGLETNKEKVDSFIKGVAAGNREVKFAEIIVDHIPYENQFITFPADLKPLRSREDMDAVWSDIEQNLKNIFPVQIIASESGSINWPKYIKVLAAIVVMFLFTFILINFFDHRPIRDRVVEPPIAIPLPDENNDAPIVIEETTGCYIETSQLTRAHHKPEPFSTTTGTFPRNKKYQVLDTEIYNHGNLAEIHFFLIEDPERRLKGWVNSRSLNFISSDCMEN